MSRSLSGWQAVVLGAVVLVGGLLALGGVLAVGSRGWYGSNALHVRVGFAEVRGVEVGTRVRIRGVDAGEVVAISPPDDAEGEVVLRLRIKGAYKNQVRNNSTVQIVSEGMIGGKVLEVRPPAKGKKAGPPAGEDELLRSEPTAELTDVLAQVSDTLQGVNSGKDGLGKELVGAIRSIKEAADTGKEALAHSKKAIDRGEETMTALQQATDASKKLPILRSYVQDPVALLVRANAERNRKVLAEAELFEPGRAELTAGGRAKLDEVGRWMNMLKHSGSDVVIVAYADPRHGAAATAKEVTRQQAEGVANYLKSRHSVDSLGWISSRKVTALGMGAQPAPQPEPSLPAARVEMMVFVPRK